MFIRAGIAMYRIVIMLECFHSFLSKLVRQIGLDCFNSACEED